MSGTQKDEMFQGELFDQGLAVRRAVMGDVYVDAALARADGFSADLQKLVTEAAWGMVWTRPDLALRDRSIATIAMLAALGRSHELLGHLRGALNNGVSEAEIREVLLQVCIYAGFPAGLEAFRVAGEVILPR